MKSLKKNLKFIKLYILPIFAVAIFITIIIFMVLPKINDNLLLLDKINEENNTISGLNSQLTQLNALSSNSVTLSNKLNIVNTIAPSGISEVVKFRDKVSQLLNNNQVKIINQRISESSNTEKSTNVLVLKEIPVEFKALGTFDNIKNFLKDLVNIDDFIVVTQLNFSLTNNNEWGIEIRLSKYQFLDSSDPALEKAYLNTQLNAKLPQTIEEYINNKLSQ